MYFDFIFRQVIFDGVKKLIGLILMPLIDSFLDLKRLENYEISLRNRKLKLGKFVTEIIYIILVIAVVKVVLKQ